MADTLKDWRRQKAGRMNVTIVARSCGWHVYLYTSAVQMGDRIKRHLVAKDCIPYRGEGDAHTMLSQAQAVMLGLYGMTEGIEPECDNL